MLPVLPITSVKVPAMKRKIYFLNSHSEYSGKSGMKASKLAVKSEYADDESCMSLSFREIPGTLIPEERNIFMTTNSELTAY